MSKSFLKNISYFISFFTATLLLIFFCSLSFFFFKYSEKLFTEVKVYVYLDRGLQEKECQNIKVKIKKFLAQKNILHKMEYTSSEEALRKFLNYNTDKIIKIYNTNPLRSNFELSIKKIKFSNDLNEILDKINRIEGVFETDYFDLLDKKIDKKVWIFFGGVVFISLSMIFIVIFGISNSIKNSFLSKRFLLRTMALVGATKKFIEFPYLIQNCVSALTISILASLSFFGSLKLIVNYLNVDYTEIFKISIYFSIIILVVNLCITFFSTKIAINKCLKMTLDDYYKF